MEPDFPQERNVFSYLMDDSRKLLSYMQQNLPDPPNVAGWAAYYQSPIYGRSWINSETLKIRASFINSFIDSTAKPRYISLIIDAIKYSKKYKNVADPNKFIDDVVGNLISLPATPEYKKYLKKILLSNQESDYYWTDAWEAYLFNPADNNLKNIVEVRLRQFYKSILQIEEYSLH